MVIEVVKQRETEFFEKPKQISKEWDVVNEQIERSKIKRFPWKKIFGKTLTEVILNIKKDGLHSTTCVQILMNHPAVRKYIKENPTQEIDILKNIQIGVNARYAETETSKKILKLNPQTTENNQS